MEDYYAVLQVQPHADPDVIEAAYKRLIFKHHPDRGGDQKQATRINAAYDVLRDPVKRRRYDAQRTAAPIGQTASPRGSAQGSPPSRSAQPTRASVNPEEHKQDRAASTLLIAGAVYLGLLAFAIIGWIVTGLLPAILGP